MLLLVVGVFSRMKLQRENWWTSSAVSGHHSLSYLGEEKIGRIPDLPSQRLHKVSVYGV